MLQMVLQENSTGELKKRTLVNWQSDGEKQTIKKYTLTLKSKPVQQ